MRRTRWQARWVALGLLAAGSGSGSCAGPEPAPPSAPEAQTSAGGETYLATPTVAPELSVGEDVLAEAKALNAADKRPPPSEFRHIEARPKEPPEVDETEHGFRVQLPSRAPVVTPAVYEGLVVVSGGFRSREMYAFDARSGEPAWALSLGDDGPSMPACEDGVCVFNTESCTLFAVDAATGELKWSWYLGDPLMSAPAIAGGLVFTAYPVRGGGSWPAGEDRPMPDASHALAAFDLHSGEVQWARWIDAEVISSPVAIVDAVYAATFAGTVYKLDQKSGTLLAARAANATSAPSLVDGALYFARREDGDEGGRAVEYIMRSQKGLGRKQKDGPATESSRRPARYLDADFQSRTDFSAETVAHDAANGFSGGAPAAANAEIARRRVGRGTVHGLQEYQGSWVLGLPQGNYAAMGDELVSFDRGSGDERWSVPLPGDLDELGGTLGAPPAAAGERLVVSTLVGELLVVRPQDGDVERRFEVEARSRTQAVVDGGWIYVGTIDGQLVAVNTGDPSLTGWPTWAGNPARTGQGR